MKNNIYTDNSPHTPWTRIYAFILVFNAVLIVIFRWLRQYYNID